MSKPYIVVTTAIGIYVAEDKKKTSERETQNRVKSRTRRILATFIDMPNVKLRGSPRFSASPSRMQG
jgi:hypothetical protein